uniref:Uncharacterized protein n=1 Tax=Glossina pallidipes TaxID=7398 RepID=A0A1A9Z1P1_GLOPL
MVLEQHPPPSHTQPSQPLPSQSTKASASPPLHTQLSPLHSSSPANHNITINNTNSNNNRLPNMPPEGLHPTAALQLYAAAAQLAPAGVRVPHWSPFLQFGVPGVFGGAPFLGRPRFESAAPPNAAAAAAASQMAVNASNAFANLTGLMRNVSAVQTTAVAAVATAAIQQRLMIGNRQNLPPAGPPSEGSNEDAEYNLLCDEIRLILRNASRKIVAKAYLDNKLIFVANLYSKHDVKYQKN